MERPIIFFVIVGVVLVLILNYGGSSFFSRGPLATGPGGGFGLPSVSEPLTSGSATGAGVPETKKLEPGISPFRGEVRISYVVSDREWQKEYMRIVRSGSFGSVDSMKKVINLDGWTIENNTGNRRPIPKAFSIPSSVSPLASVELRPGDEIILASGDTAFGSSFRENTCTGYFNEFYTFDPPLAESCPKFSREELLRQKLNSACVEVIDRTPRCRQVRIGFEESTAGNECVAFAAAHINYSGCLIDNSASSDFLLDRWHLFLKSNQKMWDALHDRLILRDKEGLIVDEYNY